MEIKEAYTARVISILAYQNRNNLKTLFLSFENHNFIFTSYTNLTSNTSAYRKCLKIVTILIVHNLNQIFEILKNVTHNFRRISDIYLKVNNFFWEHCIFPRVDLVISKWWFGLKVGRKIIFISETDDDI